MSASDLRADAARLKSEASEAVSKGNQLNESGDREGAQQYWQYASQLETIARLYEERAEANESLPR